MRIACIQMNMQLGSCEENFVRAEQLVREAAAQEQPDLILLPETWNTGFFPKKTIELADDDGARTRAVFGPLARELSVNILAGSVANRRGDRVYNTAYVFDRRGDCIASYDKTHLFSPMGENLTFTPGDALCRFTLEGMRCAIIICYDLRFPELTRSLALPGLDLLLLPAQWPDVRIPQLQTLALARAIENQMYVALCNSCGHAVKTQFGGRSRIIGPLGDILAEAGEAETVIAADADPAILEDIRARIPVFQDRRPELYRTDC